MKLTASSIAKSIAEEIRTSLVPYCTKIYIAGSIRRKKNRVKDIEIVCLPHTEQTGQIGMFDSAEIRTIHNQAWQKKVLQHGTVVKGNLKNGRYIKLAHSSGIQVDIFCPQPADFYRQLAIRTGNAEYVKNNIAAAWVKTGWVGTADGLRRRDQVTQKYVSDKPVWKCVIANPLLPPVWQSEQHFFHWLKVKYVQPQHRN